LRIANGGDKALKIAASRAPTGLILLDPMMPRMDNNGVRRRLKRKRFECGLLDQRT